MATIDGSIDDPSPVEALAARADVYQIAAALIRGADLAQKAEPDDVLRLAEFLAGSDY